MAKKPATPLSRKEKRHAALVKAIADFKTQYKVDFDDPANTNSPVAALKAEAARIEGMVVAYEQAFNEPFDPDTPPEAPAPAGASKERLYAGIAAAAVVVAVAVAFLPWRSPAPAPVAGLTAEQVQKMITEAKPAAPEPKPQATGITPEQLNAAVAAALAKQQAPAKEAQTTAKQLAPNQFIGNDGEVWTITGGGNGRPVSVPHMIADAAKACPHRRIKLEPRGFSSNPPMTKEQKARGDKRWHPECDWSSQVAQAQ